MNRVKQFSFIMITLMIFSIFIQNGVAQWQTVVTKSVSPGGTSSSLKNLNTGDQWQVEFTVIGGGGIIDFYIFNSTNRQQFPTWPYEYYYNVNSTSGQYILTADADDEYSATLHNSGSTTLTVEVRYMELGTELIYGYPIITLFAVILIVTVYVMKKRRMLLNK